MAFDYNEPTNPAPKKKLSKKQQNEEALRQSLADALTDTKCLNFVNDAFVKADNFYNNYRQDWLRYYGLYNGIFNSTNHTYKGRANIFVPMVFSAIETILPRLVSNRPKTTVVPVGAEDLMGAKKMDNVVSFFWDKMQMKRTIKMWQKGALLYGTSIVKLWWDSDEQMPKARVMDMSGGEIVIDPQASCDDDAQYAIHTYEKDLEDVKANKKYKNTGQLGASNWPNMKQDRYFLKGKSWTSDTLYKKCLIREFWGEYDGEDWLIITANNSAVIYKEKMPYKHGELPFTRLVDTELPNEYLGIGEVEPIERLQYELNDTRNQRMDNVTLILNRMWKVAKGADVNESELVSQPGGVIHAADINGIEPLVTPDVTQSAYNEEGQIKADIQSITGVNDMAPTYGGNKDSNAATTTARGLALAQELANARFQLKLDNMDDALRRFGRQLVQLIQQYAPKEMLVRILDDKGYQWVPILKDDIKGAFDFSVEMGASQPQNRLTRRAEARELLTTVLPAAQLVPNGTQILAKTMRFLYDTYEMPDLESVLPADVTGMPQQPAQQQQQGMPNQMPNMGGQNVMGSMPGPQTQINPNQSLNATQGAQLGGARNNPQPAELYHAGPNPTGVPGA